MSVATTRRDDALRHRERRAGDPEQLRRTTVRDRLPHALGDVVLALEETEATSPGGQVLDVARHGVDEVVHLRDDGRNDRRANRNDCDDRADEHDRDRESAPGDPASLQRVDGRIERGREKDRDEDPDQDSARCLDDLDQHDRREDDSEDDQDRARPEADEALLHRGGAYGAARTALLSRIGRKPVEGIEPS